MRKMRSIIWGQVTQADKYNEKCRCYSKDAKFSINNVDIIDRLKLNYSNVSYITFDSIPEELRDFKFGQYDSLSDDYERLSNIAKELNLLSFTGSVDTVHLYTCYSEWTCGEEEDVQYLRLGELANLQNKYIIMFF